MTPEDTIAEQLLPVVSGAAGVTAVRDHHPWVSNEGFEQFRVIVFPAAELEVELADRGGRVTVDVDLIVLLGQQVARLDLAAKDAIAQKAVDIEAAIKAAPAVKEISGYALQTVQRSRFHEEWLELGVYAPFLTLRYRRAAV